MSLWNTKEIKNDLSKMCRIVDVSLGEDHTTDGFVVTADDVPEDDFNYIYIRGFTCFDLGNADRGNCNVDMVEMNSGVGDDGCCSKEEKIQVLYGMLKAYFINKGFGVTSHLDIYF